MPIGRLSGFGVNFSTRFPYALGASSNGEGGIILGGDGDFGGNVFVLVDWLFAAVFAAFAPCSAKTRYEVLKALDWQSRHRSLSLRANDMILS